MTGQRLSVGSILGGRYQLDELIGQGGMGQVFRASDLTLGRPVAVKLILASFGERDDAEARFRREASLGAAVNHPGLVHTFDVGRDQGHLYLVMEYFDGEDLTEFRDRWAPVPVAQVIAIASGVASALSAAHDQGLVHRDLKPENIMLDGGRPDAPRILDFGMAVAPNSNDVTGRLTIDGAIGGTPQYMAPEQAAGSDPTPAVDVYAFGCVLFELVTGAPPFDAGSLALLLAKHLYSPPPSMRERRQDVPAALDELVSHMMAKAPQSRPAMRRVGERLAKLATADPAAVIDAKAPPAIVSPDGARPPVVCIHSGRTAELELALGAAGCVVVSHERVHDGGGGEVECAVALGASLEQLAILCADDAAVIADLDVSDVARRIALIRVGVHEVVSRPVRPEDLITKVRRAAHHRRRRLGTNA